METTILLTAINAKYIHSNLAVYSLKAYAGEHTNISIAEFTINNRIEDILDEIYVKKPDVLAFSCYIWNIEYVKKIMVELHKLLPDTDIWLGGPEVSYNTDYYLEKYDFITGIFVGEGEASFKEVTSYYITGEGSLDDIAGICTKTRRTPLARECVDMSDIPFPYKDLSNFENRIIYYESSRGCPFSCTYCLSSIDKRLRFRNVELVKTELKFFLDRKVPQVKFIDRTFNCDKKRALEIWKFISDNDNGVTNFHFEIAADLINDEQIEILNNMRAGLVQLEIGVQSTNEKTIEAIGRKMDLVALRSVVEKLKQKENIHIHLDLIAGLPYEDMESFKRSFNDVYSMKPDELQLGFLKVLYGSYMYEDAKEYGIVYKDFPPYEVLYTRWLTYDEILLLKKVEEVLEIYYGSGQFRNTVNYLMCFFETPYNFYESLGIYYEAAHRKGEKHARIERYKLLLEFAQNIKDIDICMLKELLTLDVYLRENIKTRPYFARDLSHYKEEIRGFASSGNMLKTEHIEVFSKKTLEHYPEVKNIIGETVFVKFDYDRRNPVNYDAEMTVLNGEKC